MITAQNKTKILKIFNVFETGAIEGKYGSVVRMSDGLNRIRQIPYGRSQTTEYGNLNVLSKNIWIEAYVNARHNWLAYHGNALLHNTVYRTQVFLKARSVTVTGILISR